MRLSILCIAFAAGCGASRGGAVHPGVTAGGIAAAALPYHIVDARTGHQLTASAFLHQLAAARAVCIGEEHDNPHHHWVQLELVRQLVAQWPRSALGMEMIQRPFQGVLDDFAARRIDEATLRSRVGWAERWSYDYRYYGPTIEAARSAHAALLALGTPKELAKKVAHDGLESLDSAERAQVPQLNLHDAAHRKWFDDVMTEMGSSDQPTSPHKPSSASADPQAAATKLNPDHMYAVQVIWDETMADAAATWLAHNAAGHIAILTGNGHCHDSAIVRRIQRRGVASVVSVRSVIDDGEGSVADVLVAPTNDFIVVLEPPR